MIQEIKKQLKPGKTVKINDLTYVVTAETKNEYIVQGRKGKEFTLKFLKDDIEFHDSKNKKVEIKSIEPL